MDYLSIIKNIERSITISCQKTNRTANSLKLIAVSKQFPINTINDYLGAVSYYLTEETKIKKTPSPCIGENKVQEVLNKKVHLKKHELHFIGHLQTNKVKQLLPHIDFLHSLDSIKLANAINNNLEESNKSINNKKSNKIIKVLVQANTSKEINKYGGNFADTVELLQHCQTLPNIEICGLMTIAPFSEDKEEIRDCFKELRLWRDEISKKITVPLPELSMGMSHDFMIAIEEGATMIRIGSTIFGNRNYNK